MAGSFGNGATLVLGSTTVSEITKVSSPGFKADTIDTTTHNNSDKFRTFIKGLTDGGEITVEGNMNYTDYNTLYVMATTLSAYTATVTVPTTPSSSQWVASTLLTGLESGAPHDDKIDFSATLKVSGKPTFAKV